VLNFPKVIVMSALVAVSGSIYADAGKQELMQLAAVSAGFDVERTYMQNCFACHSTGAAGAPKVGTAADWAPRAEKGIDALVASAIKGVNAMPPKGLCIACNDDDIKALVTYMVDSSK
jgi:cytochrome c5